MANTVNVPVTKGWQLALSAPTQPLTGVISIGGGGEYCEQNALPDDDLTGHVFTGMIIPFDLQVGQNIYVNTYRDSDIVIITED